MVDQLWRHRQRTLYMYGDKAIEVLKDLKHNQWIPMYNNEGVGRVMQEMDLIYAELIKCLNDDSLDRTDDAVKTNITTYHYCFLRSKRCMLAYLYERMQRIKRVRWQCGVTLPTHIEVNMHQTEKEFFDKYEQLLSDYNADLEMDLTSDLQPPKDIYVEVRIVKTDDDKDGGIVLEDRTLKLRKNHIYYLKRSDAETLVQRGYAQQINVIN